MKRLLALCVTAAALAALCGCASQTITECLLSRIRDNKHYHDIPVITTFSICGVIVEMKPQKTRDNSQHIRKKSLSRNPIRCP